MREAAEDCLFITGHGWDAAWTRVVDMHTAFLNCPGQNLYPLAPEPTFNVPDLKQLSLKL